MDTAHRKTILLVEDEVLIAMAESIVLREFGYDVLRASSGKEAVAIACGERLVDLILMDIDLGKGISGPEAAELILGVKTLPIVFLTSHAEQEMVKKVRGITRYGYVIKNSGEFVLQSSIEMAFELYDAHTQLEEGNSRIHQLAEQARIVTWEVDAEGLYTYVSHAAEKIYGYTPDEIVGRKHFYDLHPSDGRAEFRDKALKFFQQREELKEFTNPILQKNGPCIWVATNGLPLLDDAGNLTGYRGTDREITEHREILHRLEMHSHALQSIMESVTVTDLKDRFIYVNDAFCRTYGYEPGEVMGRHVDILKAPDTDQRQLAAIHVGARGDGWQGELVNVRKNGERFYIRLLTSPIRDENQNPIALVGVAEDISARIQTESQKEAALLRVKERDLQLSNAAAIAHLGPWEYDFQTDTFFFNDHFYAVYHTSAEAAGGYTMRSATYAKMFVHPEDAECVATELAVARETRDSAFHRELDHRILYADGGIGFIHVRYVIKKDDAGNTIKSFGVNQDITARKEAEQALRDSERLFRSLVTSLLDPILIVSFDGMILFANPAAYKLVGLPESENVTQMNFGRFLDPGDVHIVMSDLQRVGMTGGPQTSEYKIHDMAGNVYWVEARGTKISYRGGEADLVTLRNITERQRDALALRESENRLSMIANNSTDVIWTMDLAGKFTYISPSVLQLRGYTPEEIMCQSMDEIISPDSQQLVSAKIQRAIDCAASGSEYSPEYSEIEQPRKDGSTVWTEVVSRIMYDESGKAMGILGVSRNIEERRRSEEKIRKLLAEKELLLKEVHHRVKNNINAVMSLLSLQSGTLSDRAAIAALKDTQSRLNSMRLLYDKLNISEEYEHVPVESYLSSLVDDVVANFPNRGIVTVTRHIENFILDANRLCPLGIIMNELLTNAMKYAFVGRNSGVIALSASVSGNRATVALQDDGIGIPESVDVGISTGFGLQLVDMLTAQLEGTIRIEREDGTKFVLEFDL